MPSVFTVRATAQIPGYADPSIYARSGVTGFNLPNFSSFNSATAAINDHRQLALDVNVVGSTGNPGVFLGNYNQGAPVGGIVADASDVITGDPELNHVGQMVFTVGLSSSPFLHDIGSGSTTAINYPLGVTASDALAITDSGRLGGRLSFGFAGRAYGVFAAQSSGFPALDVYAVDAGLDASSPYSFLYTPSLSQGGGPGDTPRIAAKISTTAGFDFEQIFIFESGGGAMRIAAETSTDPSSMFSEFVTNSVSISDNGQHVVFQANNLQGVSGIYRYSALTDDIDRMAFVGNGVVSAIDFFAADVNDSGLVTFRGMDVTGMSSVFVADVSNTLRLFGEGDTVLTDLGVREIGRRDGQSSQSGAPRINNRGDVSFSFQYFDPSNPQSVADGGLLMLMAAALLGDFNSDDLLDCADVDVLVGAIAGGSQNLLYDLNGDSQVTALDLNEWLALAGAANLPSGNAYLPGDANLDGTVDALDFIIWNEHKFTATAEWCSGDFNADGTIDALDFIAWNEFKFQSADGTATYAIPEPSGALYWLALAAWTSIRRRPLAKCVRHCRTTSTDGMTPKPADGSARIRSGSLRRIGISRSMYSIALWHISISMALVLRKSNGCWGQIRHFLYTALIRIPLS